MCTSQNVDHKMRFRSKKGQLPFIELNGEEIADSAIIIKELSAKYEKNLDAGLTAEQRNVSYATIAMLENHLIWIIFYWRAKYPDNVLKGYKVNLQHALGLRLPNSILNFFFKITFGRKVNIHKERKEGKRKRKRRGRTLCRWKHLHVFHELTSTLWGLCLYGNWSRLFRLRF